MKHDDFEACFVGLACLRAPFLASCLTHKSCKEAPLLPVRPRAHLAPDPPHTQVLNLGKLRFPPR